MMLLTKRCLAFKIISFIIHCFCCCCYVRKHLNIYWNRKSKCIIVFFCNTWGRLFFSLNTLMAWTNLLNKFFFDKSVTLNTNNLLFFLSKLCANFLTQRQNLTRAVETNSFSAKFISVTLKWKLWILCIIFNAANEACF